MNQPPNYPPQPFYGTPQPQQPLPQFQRPPMGAPGVQPMPQMYPQQPIQQPIQPPFQQPLAQPPPYQQPMAQPMAQPLPVQQPMAQPMAQPLAVQQPSPMQPAGFGQPVAAPLPWLNRYLRGVDPRAAWVWFSAADQHGGAGRLNAFELKNALRYAGENLSDDTVLTMMQMFDLNSNGTIEFNEFLTMLGYLTEAKEAFQSTSTSGTLGVQPTSTALQRLLPFSLEPQGVQTVYYRFVQPQQMMDLDRFLRMAFYMGKVHSIYQIQNPGMVTFSPARYYQLLTAI